MHQFLNLNLSRFREKLHQILSFKYLGFSLNDIKNKILPLNTPTEVVSVLEYQERIIEEQIENLNEALQSIKSLHSEVLNIKKVDFKKYADIIELLRLGNKNYWVWKILDETLIEHIKDKFSDSPELGDKIIQTYIKLIDETLLLKRSNIAVNSIESVELSKLWWQMISDFTGGNMDLLPNLMEFNNDISSWNYEISEKQKEINDYLGEMLGYYFEVNKINV